MINYVFKLICLDFNNRNLMIPVFDLKGNTRVVTQSALQTFQEEMDKVKKDPYKLVMRQTKLPITLLNEKAKVSNHLNSFVGIGTFKM